MKLFNKLSPMKLLLMGAFTLGSSSVNACPVEPFLGGVCMTAAKYCPQGYQEANGAMLQVSQYSALFALLGTQYGGDGRTTFALPDLGGRTPVGHGQGAGLSGVTQGAKLGQERVTLTEAHLPAHTHSAAFTGSQTIASVKIPVSEDSGSNSTVPSDTHNHLAASPGGPPSAAIWSAQPNNIATVAGAEAAFTPAGSVTVQSRGDSQAFDNRPPQLGMRFCIAVQGVFPPRD